MKREKSILRKAKEATKDVESYWKKQIASIRRKRLPLYKLARTIQPILNGNSVHVGMSEIAINCESIEESRKLVGQILENTGIESFIITMEKSWSEELLWHYKGIFKGIKVFVGPSPPSSECKPVLKSSASAYWVCEKK